MPLLCLLFGCFCRSTCSLGTGNFATFSCDGFLQNDSTFCFSLKVTLDLSNSFCHQNLGVIQFDPIDVRFFLWLLAQMLLAKVAMEKGSKWEFSGNRERKDVWWFRLVTTWRRCYNSYINVTFYFFDSGSLAMMAMAFIFKTWTSFQPTHPIFTAEVSTMDGGENQKKRNAFFRGNLLWCLKRSKIWLRSIFCPKNKAMVVNLIPGYPQILRIFQVWDLKSPNEPDGCTWSPFWGLLMDEKSKIQSFFNPFSKMAMMRCFSYIKRWHCSWFYNPGSQHKPHYWKDDESAGSFQPSNVSAFSKNAGRCKKVQLSNQNTKI